VIEPLVAEQQEPSILSEEDVGGTPSPVPYIPVDVMGEATILAAADDNAVDFNKKVQDNILAINSGKFADLQRDVVKQERESYLSVLAEKAATAVSVANLEGARAASERYVEMQRQHLKMVRDKIEVDASTSHRVVANRAVEFAAYADPDTTRVAKGPLLESTVEYGEALGIRRHLEEVLSKLEEPGTANKVTHFLLNLPPFLPVAQEITYRNIAARLTKNKDLPYFATPDSYIQAIHQAWVGMDDDGKRAMLHQLVNDEYGMFGDSPAARKDFIERLISMSPGDAMAVGGFNAAGLVLDATLVGPLRRLMGGIGGILRKGSTAKVMREVAGARYTGTGIADDMATKSPSRLNLNDADSTGAAIAAGHHPYTYAPDNITGTAPHVQERLSTHWSQMVAAEREKLSTSGMPADEVANATKAIEAAYSPTTRKEVYSIQFGDPVEGRANFTVVMQGMDGKGFKSVASLKTGARQYGLADDAYEVVTRAQMHAEDAAVVRSSMRGYHGSGEAFDEFKEKFIGMGQGGSAMGHGFSASLTKGLAERAARARGGERGSAFVYSLDLPDRKQLLDLDKGFTKQSTEVKAALAKVLTPEEIAALKNADGRDIYNALAKRLGSTKAASHKLDQVGVLGNTGKLGTEQEVLIFNENVMTAALRKRTERPDLVPTQKDLDAEAKFKAEAAEGDEAARALMQDFGMDDPVKASIAMQKGWSDRGAEAMQRASKTTNFDNPATPIWRDGDAPTQFSGAYDEETQGVARGFLKLIGLENERVLFVHSLEVDRLAARPEFQASPGLKITLGNFIEGLVAEGGQFARLRMPDGSFRYLVGVNADLKEAKGLITMAHEVGHVFKYALEHQLNPKMAAAIKGEFITWARGKGGSIQATAEIAERVFTATSQHANMLSKIRRAATDPAYAKELGEGTMEQWGNWVRHYDEFFAEQMAKYLTTDARAVTAGEKAMKGFADKISDFYHKAVATMIRVLGTGAMKLEPEAAFKTMIDEYISRLATRRFNETVDSLDFTGTASSLGGAETATRVAGKPHIKPKLDPEEYFIRMKIDDPVVPKNGYDPADIDSMPWVAADPRHGVSTEAMTGRVIGVHQTAKQRRDMTNFLKDPLKALSKKQRERVLSVLEEGDQASFAGGYGREFTASELLARDFTQKELEAYFTVRQARMFDYFVYNKAQVDSMRRKGLNEIEVYGQNKFVGRPIALEEAVRKNGTSVYSMRDKDFVELNAEKAYASGQRMIEAPHGATVDGREVTAFLSTEAEATARKVHTAIHYRPGEFARIYNDSYFIRMGVTKAVDGKKAAVEYPIRSAATEKEAKEFVDAVTRGRQMVLDGAAPVEIEKVVGKFYGTEEFQHEVTAGALKDMTSLRFHFSREVDDYLGQTLESHARGGKLFTRDRGEHIGTADRTRAVRSNILNPYESLSREVTMVSHFSNVNQWKEAQIAKWMNTFSDMLPSNVKTGNDITDFFKVAGAKFSHVTGKRGLFAERTHRYIMRQVGIQTQEHRWWQSLMRRVGEGVMPYVGEGVGAVIRDASPLNFIRSWNHHATLGAFNISQLIVQANGMSIAAAIHPIYGAKAAALYPALRIALMSDNPEVWAKIAAVAGEDVGRLAKAIRKSGLIDNLRSTSLHNIEDGKMDIFASMPRRGLGTAIDKGAFFFNRGEEAARVISFDIARREWEKLNPGKDFLSNEGMAAILQRADDFTMNMTRANLARWQEGILSIPTQFLQYNIKLMQGIVSGLAGGGRAFSRADAAKALAGSIAFYGTAGMGISSLMGEWIPDEVEASMSPAMKTAIGQGVFAAALKSVGEAMTGERVEVALGSRLGSINFFTDMVYDAFTDPKNIYEAMLGPTRSTGERLGIIADVVSLWRKQPEVTFDDVGKAALEVFAAQLSSARNVTKAYYVAQGNNILRDRKGQPVAELSTPEIWAQAVGLAPAAAYDYYSLIDSKRAYFRALDDIAAMVMDTQKKIVQARNAGDLERVDKLSKALQLMWPQNYGDFMHVKRQVTRNLFPYDTEFQKALVEYTMKPANYSKPLMTTTPIPLPAKR
jgi:hypothetical protein